MTTMLSWTLPPALDTAVQARLRAWDAAGATRRLWQRDARLWTGGDESRWLGWLDVAARQRAVLPHLDALRRDIVRSGFTHVAVLGMGGSSLCPFVLERAFGPQPGWPTLRVLDSTDPGQVAAFEASLDLARTLFVVASKSGSTLEPSLLRDHFVARTGRPKQFLAITDPGSALEREAHAAGFRAVVHGEPAIGGRFSALSAFGLVPAVLAGLDTDLLLQRAEEAMAWCGAAVSADANAGVRLGVAMAVAAAGGRDKLTLVASPAVAELGAWLEQLVAESTGKRGQAIIPVDRETVAEPARYGDDRLFVYLRLATGADPSQDRAVDALERAGQPVVRVTLRDRYDLAAQFYQWEFATAVAGSVLGIHPFDQPDVEAAKVEARRLMAEVEREGRLPAETPLTPGPALTAALRSHLGTLRPGDYCAVLAYVEMCAAHTTALQRLRHRVRDRRRVATTLGFGPRYLHSTGQAHKGGPDTGVFLVLTAEPAADLPVPGKGYTFGVVEAAQARGDAAVLAQRGRRTQRVHLGPDVPAELARLDAAVQAALD
jgi:transaldolase/glucose-6-phosphate isomerase